MALGGGLAKRRPTCPREITAGSSHSSRRLPQVFNPQLGCERTTAPVPVAPALFRVTRSTWPSPGPLRIGCLRYAGWSHAMQGFLTHISKLQLRWLEDVHLLTALLGGFSRAGGRAAHSSTANRCD